MVVSPVLVNLTHSPNTSISIVVFCVVTSLNTYLLSITDTSVLKLILFFSSSMLINDTFTINTYNIKTINKIINPGNLKKPINKIDKILKGKDILKNCPIKLNIKIEEIPIINDFTIYLIVFIKDITN
jgi:hypothetical protein